MIHNLIYLLLVVLPWTDDLLLCNNIISLFNKNNFIKYNLINVLTEPQGYVIIELEPCSRMTVYGWAHPKYYTTFLPICQQKNKYFFREIFYPKIKKFLKMYWQYPQNALI